MHRLHIFALTTLLLPAAAWAQEAEMTTGAAPEEIAARTMKAMEALDSSATKGTKPGTVKAKEAILPEAARDLTNIKSDKEDEETVASSLLPAVAAEGGRGMDPMSRARLDMMVPTGRSHRGVHYPMYRPLGTDRAAGDPLPAGLAGVTASLASLFESDIVTRLDDDHVQFDRAKWVQFDDKPAAAGKAQPTMSLEIERGVYDLKNEILMTNQPVRIENPQFVITGDTMLHDRASGLTRLTGRVHMVFYNEEPEPAAAPAPVPAADPIPETPRKP